MQVKLRKNDQIDAYIKGYLASTQIFAGNMTVMEMAV